MVRHFEERESKKKKEAVKGGKLLWGRIISGSEHEGAHARLVPPGGSKVENSSAASDWKGKNKKSRNYKWGIALKTGQWGTRDKRTSLCLNGDEEGELKGKGHCLIPIGDVVVVPASGLGAPK